MKQPAKIARVLVRSSSENSLALLFFITAALVFLMVILGGITRLTGSGLSMVDWRPLTGFLPPLTELEWERVFALYKGSPEYQKVNYGMDLAGFRQIFWLEYFHRLLGRLIGIFFLVPLLYVFLRRELRAWRVRTILVFGLGGVQGVIGWLMVKSGLSHEPWVSPYRLCLHLMTAFVTCSILVWFGLMLRAGFRELSFSKAFETPQIFLLFVVLLLTIVYGAFVAGMKAGLIYNTFPLMGETFLPGELLYHRPWYSNFLMNPVTVQFTHRGLAFSAVLLMGWVLVHDLKHSTTKTEKAWLKALGLALLGQALLGVLTLLYHVPLVLAVAHQGWALVTLSLLIRVLFEKAVKAVTFYSSTFEQSFNPGQPLAFDKF
jgi:Uncharacterized protein required for cytochrome oxidase assembly